MKESKFPFKQLGSQLKNLREKLQESQAEVCSAVEINMDQLVDFENGQRRPSEEILILLINHFNPREEQIAKLWDLAGFAPEKTRLMPENLFNNVQAQMQPAVIVMPIDGRIVYSDTVHVMVNNHGVVMNFMQNSGADNKPVAIARIGMSKDHAKSVLEVLRQTMAQHEQKSLPSQTNTDPDKKNK